MIYWIVWLKNQNIVKKLTKTLFLLLYFMATHFIDLNFGVVHIYYVVYIIIVRSDYAV